MVCTEHLRWFSRPFQDPVRRGEVLVFFKHGQHYLRAATVDATKVQLNTGHNQNSSINHQSYFICQREELHTIILLI